MDKECPECGAEIGVDAPQGLCRRCLLGSALARGGTLHVRCPHCQNGIEIVSETEFSDVMCPTCNSQFGLIGNRTPVTFDVDYPIEFGRFSLLEQIGMGSFGTVYRAHDRELDRIVAMKFPRRSGLTFVEAELFLREAQTVAKLSHSHIVRVHEVGQEAGQLFIVCDYVDGPDLADWLQKRQPTTIETVRLCSTIAGALDYAHAEGVVHRDLKPSNILLKAKTIASANTEPTYADLGDYSPIVTDFGLAKSNAAEITITAPGRILGTPAYMSPEQAMGDGYHADHRSDVYSVGVILFELLTGEKPFRGNVHSLLQQVLHEEPPRVRRFNSTVPVDLETICLKCLSKDPGDRYPSAGTLRDELERFERGESILARPPPSWLNAWRWCARNRMVASLLAACVLCLSVAAVVSSLAYVSSNRKNRELSRSLYAMRIRAAGSAMSQPGGMAKLSRQLDLSTPAELSEELRGWEWNFLNALRKNDLSTLRGHKARLTATRFSPNGSRLVTASADGTVRIWSASGWRQIDLIEGHIGTVSTATWSPDGAKLATAGEDKTVRIWNAENGIEIATISLPDRVNDVDWNINDQLAVACDDHSVTIWNAADQTRIDSFTDHDDRVFTVRWSPDGRLLASAADDENTFRVRNLDGERPTTFKGHQDDIRALAWSPEGARIVTGSWDFTAIVWDVQSGTERSKLTGHRNFVDAVTWSPDGRRVATASADSTARIWDVVDEPAQIERSPIILRGHTGPLSSIDWSPTDDQMLVTASTDSTAKVWSTLAHAESVAFDGHMSVSWSRDSRSIVTASENGGLKIVEAETGIVLSEFGNEMGQVEITNWSNDGRRIAAENGSILRVFDAETKTTIGPQIQLPSDPVSLDWNSDGMRVLTGDYDRKTRIWNSQTGELLQTLAPSLHMCAPAFSTNGKFVAAPNPDAVRVWSVDTGELQFSLESLAGFTVAWAPDDESLAVACGGVGNGHLQIWNTSNRRRTLNIPAHSGWTMSVCWSPDGKRIATGGADHLVRVWDVPTGEELLTLHGHTDKVTHVQWSPDGKKLGAASWNHVIRVWDASRGY